MGKLGGLLVRQYNRYYKELMDDLTAFGRSRRPIWYWIDNALEDIYRENVDLYKFVVRLLETEKWILRFKDLFNMYRLVGFYSGFVDLSLSRKVLEKSIELIDSRDIPDKFIYYLDLLKIAYSHNLIKTSKSIRKMINREIVSAEPFKKIVILSRLGSIVATVDLFEAECIFNEAKSYLGELDFSEKVSALIQLGYYLKKAFPRETEGDSLIKKSLEMIDSEKWIQKIFVLYMHVLPYIYNILPIWGDRIFNRAMKFIRPNVVNYARVINMARDTAKLGNLDTAEQILQFIEMKIQNIDFSVYEKVYLLSLIANAWTYIDGRRSSLLLPVIYRDINIALKYIDDFRVYNYVLDAISLTTEVDLISPFDTLVSVLEKVNDWERISVIAEKFRDVFPKDIRGLIIKKLYNNGIKNKRDLGYVVLSLYAVDSSVKKIYLERLLKILLKPSYGNIMIVSELINRIHPYDAALANQLIDFALDQVNELDIPYQISSLIELAKNISRIDKNFANKLIEEAISKLDILEDAEKISVLSEVTEVLEQIGEDYWAEQIKSVIKNEYRVRKYKRKVE